MSGSLPRIARLLGVFCAIGLGVRCAHVEPPSGGPVDATPPAVAAVYPAPDARGVPRDARVVFQFSEWIDRNAARNQVLVSPPYRGRTRLEVDGDRLTVFPAGGQGLRPGTTHVVTVLGTLKDLRSNPLGREFTLRFSTGAALDSAGLSGELSADSRRGRFLAALFPAPASKGDSAPKPWLDLPAWLAAADSTGRFRAAGAPAGDYALFAFEDLNGNFAFDLGFEAAATGALSLSLRPRAPDQALRLAPLDTLPLRIADATFASDLAPADSANTALEFLPGMVFLRFARTPHPARAAEPARYRILPDSGAPLPVLSVGWNAERGAWGLEVPPLRAGASYRVEMRGRPDFPGRPGAGASEGATALDSSGVFVAERAAKSQEWILTPLQPAGTTGPSGLARTMSSPLPGARHTFASSLPLTDARWSMLEKRLAARFAADSLPVTPRVRRIDRTTLALDLSRPLRMGGALELKLPPAPGDSLPARVLYAGRAADSSQTGSLRFKAPRGNSADAKRVYWLREVSAQVPAEYTLARAGNGQDSLKASLLPAARYRLLSFRDDDGDGVWDAGALRPWIPQEPVETVLDTVTVMQGEAVDVTERLAK